MSAYGWLADLARRDLQPPDRGWAMRERYPVGQRYTDRSGQWGVVLHHTDYHIVAENVANGTEWHWTLDWADANMVKLPAPGERYRHPNGHPNIIHGVDDTTGTISWSATGWGSIFRMTFADWARSGCTIEPGKPEPPKLQAKQYPVPGSIHRDARGLPIGIVAGEPDAEGRVPVMFGGMSVPEPTGLDSLRNALHEKLVAQQRELLGMAPHEPMHSKVLKAAEDKVRRQLDTMLAAGIMPGVPAEPFFSKDLPPEVVGTFSNKLPENRHDRARKEREAYAASIEGRLERLGAKRYELQVLLASDCNCRKCNVPLKADAMVVVSTEPKHGLRVGYVHCMRCGEHLLREQHAAWLDLRGEQDARRKAQR